MVCCYLQYVSSMTSDIRAEWHKCVFKHVQLLAEKFNDCTSDKERLQVCWKHVKSDPNFHKIVKKLRTEIENVRENYESATRELCEKYQFDSTQEDSIETCLPTLANGKHPKISSGSTLIQINYNESQGRYLQARELIKAGDVLILERPYAAVLVQENQEKYCSHCFILLSKEERNVFTCPGCQVKYCSLSCWKDAWLEYHQNECYLKPLFEILEITSHLALRLLLVTGQELLLELVQRNQEQKAPIPDNIQGCTSEGLYPGDYTCVYNLVTNTELQPNEALVSYAMDAALVTDIAFDYIYGRKCDIIKEEMGCLLLHHMEQMPCNIHAITAIVGDESRVSNKEQKRIAAAIYPTASLMNHACDPDVIVSFLGRNLVVRATHNINPGEEIAHCYGPSASRMTREIRQNLLQKQYFFICGCSACKSDEYFEEQSFYKAEFLCQKCYCSVLVSQEDSKIIGKCKRCGTVDDFSSAIQTLKESQNFFNQAIQYMESEDFQQSVVVLKKCLEKRQRILSKFDKDVAETHDVLARCYANLGDFHHASFHCEQSTQSVRRRFGAESIEYGHELHKFSQLLFNGREINKASTIIDNAIRLLTIHYGGQYCEVEELQQMKKTLKEFKNMNWLVYFILLQMILDFHTKFREIKGRNKK